MRRMNWAHGVLEPTPEIRETVKTLGQLEGIFLNASANAQQNSPPTY
jgi:hypothetical protein